MSTKSLVKFEPKQLQLMEIIARGQKDEDGNPLTWREIAKRLGVTRKTIRAWRNLPGFADATYDRAKEIIGSRLPKVLDAMADAAIEEHEVPAARLTLEVCGKLKDQATMFDQFEALYVKLGAHVTEDKECEVIQ